MLRNNAHLILVVGNDLSKLLLDVLRLCRLTTNARQDSCGLVKSSLDDKVSWRFWEQEETSGKDDSWDQLDGNRNSVGATIKAVLGGVVDAGCDHQADGDGELVTSNDSTANLAGSDLGHVQNDDS